MEERVACAVLKAHFEAAGFRITENRAFEEDGIRFEIDGFDPERRVGYEYVTTEAGDGWDVDAAVIAALAARKDRGELFVLVVDEAEAPDETTLREKATAFLAGLPAREVAGEPAGKRAAKPPPIPKSKPPPIPKAAKKPAAKKPAAQKPAKKPAAKKPAKKR